ncbi:MucR family transcriptional regulator [Methylobacterium nodulans]|uniref:MucR family transcriptional regulator n=1 Tax=Methylobacterium nodulans TaxID=114616 RepID=UPI0002F51A02
MTAPAMTLETRPTSILSSAKRHRQALDRRQKLLTRHRARGASPERYRAKWGLPLDYPMVAANYAAQRSELAKNSGLGRKGAAGRSGGRSQAKAR